MVQSHLHHTIVLNHPFKGLGAAKFFDILGKLIKITRAIVVGGLLPITGNFLKQLRAYGGCLGSERR